jgi:hypothetical protein
MKNKNIHADTINYLNKIDHNAIDQDVKAAQDKRKKERDLLNKNSIESQFEYDYSQTFKYEQGSSSSNWLIYTGRQNGDKFYLMTPSIAFFNFETEAEAKKFCEQLNKIADKVNHSNKHNY